MNPKAIRLATLAPMASYVTVRFLVAPLPWSIALAVGAFVAALPLLTLPLGESRAVAVLGGLAIAAVVAVGAFDPRLDGPSWVSSLAVGALLGLPAGLVGWMARARESLSATILGFASAVFLGVFELALLGSSSIVEGSSAGWARAIEDVLGGQWAVLSGSNLGASPLGDASSDPAFVGLTLLALAGVLAELTRHPGVSESRASYRSPRRAAILRLSSDSAGSTGPAADLPGARSDPVGEVPMVLELAPPLVILVAVLSLLAVSAASFPAALAGGAVGVAASAGLVLTLSRRERPVVRSPSATGSNPNPARGRITGPGGVGPRGTRTRAP